MYLLIFHRSVGGWYCLCSCYFSAQWSSTSWNMLAWLEGKGRAQVSGTADNRLFCPVPIQCYQLPFPYVWYEGPSECIAIWSKILTLTCQCSQTLGFSKFIWSMWWEKNKNLAVDVCLPADRNTIATVNLGLSLHITSRFDFSQDGCEMKPRGLTQCLWL